MKIKYVGEKFSPVALLIKRKDGKHFSKSVATAQIFHTDASIGHEILTKYNTEGEQPLFLADRDIVAHEVELAKAKYLAKVEDAKKKLIEEQRIEQAARADEKARAELEQEVKEQLKAEGFDPDKLDIDNDNEKARKEAKKVLVEEQKAAEAEAKLNTDVEPQDEVVIGTAPAADEDII